jgi:tetratricopeptide (TPR) repeat protein
MRCEAAGLDLQRIASVMAEAEELLRDAPCGSLPWVQAVFAYIQGAMLAGRIGDLLAAIGRLREAVPVPEALGKMSFAFIPAILLLEILGQVEDASAMEAQLISIVAATDDREPIARFWRLVAVAMRAAYAHEDPWTALQDSDALQPICDATGGEHMFLVMQVLRGMNLWFLGAVAAAEPILKESAAADEALGVASSVRRFALAWLLADRGALDEARALAAQLVEHGRAQGNPLAEGRGHWVLAEVLRRAGDLDAADRESAVALGMAVPLDRPGVLGTLAMLRLAGGRAADALAAAEEATAACAAMGGCGQYRGAFVRLARAEALHATGALEAAREAIADARARLLATADEIPDPGFRASFLEAVPENARTLALARAWGGEPAPRP